MEDKVGKLAIYYTGALVIYLGTRESPAGWTSHKAFFLESQQIGTVNFSVLFWVNTDLIRKYKDGEKPRFLFVGKANVLSGLYISILDILGAERAFGFSDPKLGYLIVSNLGADLDKQKKAKARNIPILTEKEFIDKFFVGQK